MKLPFSMIPYQEEPPMKSKNAKRQSLKFSFLLQWHINDYENWFSFNKSAKLSFKLAEGFLLWLPNKHDLWVCQLQMPNFNSFFILICFLFLSFHSKHYDNFIISRSTHKFFNTSEKTKLLNLTKQNWRLTNVRVETLSKNTFKVGQKFWEGEHSLHSIAT